MKSIIPVWLLILLCITLPVQAQEEAFSRHRGAGILPYTANAQGEILLLLGFQDNRGWTCFGGGPKQVSSIKSPALRWESRRETALRESMEEMRFLIPRQRLARGLESAPVFPRQAQTDDFLTFVMAVEAVDTAPFFSVAIPVDSDYSELSAVAWIPLKQLLLKVSNPAHRVVTPNGRGLWDVFWKGIQPELSHARSLNRLFPAP